MTNPNEDTELLRKADRLFDELLDLAGAERTDALQRMTDDPRLRSLLQRMLDSHSRPGILDSAPRALTAPPRQIGQWRIGDELGRGGMAVVYRAERDLGDGVQIAAIKLLTVGAIATHGSERFLREQAILARLDHPNIAGLLDAGVLEDGTPWLAMALIEGERIDAWCEHRNLDARAVVRLFLNVCDAVDHAHRRLIVHRDLKPSNILVDHSGRVRLLDFGIARLLNDDSVDVTATALRALTPRYAAPEQFGSEPTTTATDVFGLGAVLYHLLAGRPPRLQAADRDQTITLPSRAARQNNELPEARRLARSRELSGDLDTILLKALAEEPDRRYASAADMAKDLRAWLAHRPILARPGSIGYRAHRFLRRHRLGAGVAALFALLAAIGIWQNVVQRQRAEVQARRAVEVRDFLANVLSSAQPTSGPIPSLLDVLDEGSRRARETLMASDPLAAADVLLITGDTYSVADAKDKAKSDLALAYKLLISAQPPPARELADVLWTQGVNAKQAGHTEESIALYTRALEWNGRASNNTMQRIKIEKSLAGIQASAGQLDLAETTLRRLLAGVDRDGFRDTQTHLDLLNSLSFTLYLKGVGAAERIHLTDQRLQVTRTLHGADSAWYGYALADSAPMLRRAGQVVRAETVARQGVQITAGALSKPHMFSAVANCNLAAVLKQQGKTAEALEYYDRTIAIDESLGRSDLHAESCRWGRAMAHAALGNIGAARADLEADREMLTKLGKQQSTSWLNNCGMQASLLVREGDADGASRLLEDCRAEHSPATTDVNEGLDAALAKAEIEIASGNRESAMTQLSELRERLPPEATSRRWLRPWLLSVYVAAMTNDEPARRQLTEQVLDVKPVEGMLDLSIADDCLKPDPALAACLVISE